MKGYLPYTSDHSLLDAEHGPAMFAAIGKERSHGLR